ncbi:MAG: sigma-70 family RNA polymerase sigma factor [Planctomycetes bacterium]|nr:sigma-70 family RNA polymerase sigma factor [Planctomycetota bacterium]
MRPRPTNTPLDDLLREAAWIRALARRLALPGGADADDLVQEACLAALQRPPANGKDGGDNVRGWFARVLHNVVRQSDRRDRRRRRREEVRHREDPGSAPPTADLVERAATQRAVVDAVLALDEPYRAAILLRFFEGLPPRAIAQRLGVPVGTVRTHLARGLERLRRRLDDERGSRAVWLAACVPLGRLPFAAVLLATFTMKLKLLTVSALALAAVAITATSVEWQAAPATPGAARESAAAVTAGAPDERAPASESAARDRVAVAPPAAAAAPPADVTTGRLANGRVVDPEGAPLAGVEVALVGTTGEIASSAPHATSDAAAAFELTLRDGEQGQIVATAPGYRTVMAASVSANAVPQLALVVAAPAVELAGTVRTVDGRALPEARVQVVWPEDLRTRLSDISDAATTATVETAVDDGGMFALSAARVRGATLLTTAAGYLPDRRTLPVFDDRALAIVLAPPVAKPGAVQGQVVTGRGVPVAGARVVLGKQSAISGDDGTFLIADGSAGTTLAAAHAGHRRGVLEKPDAGWPAYVVLPLGGEPLAIGGRVVDAEGRGIGDAKVWLLDATLHGGGRDPAVSEGIATARVDMGELIARFRRGEIRDPENTIRRTPTTMWPFVFTDEDGHFELPGLEDRSYDLRAMALDTLLMVDLPGVPAGTKDATITLPQDGLFARVAGTVVGGDGEPVAGATIALQCDTVRVGGANMHGRGATTTLTDERGAFALENVPKTCVYLRVDGEAILPIEYGRGVEGGLLEVCGGDAEHLRLVVARRLHVQVELGDPALANGLCVLDSAGEPLPINVFVGNGRRTTDRLDLIGGKSSAFVVPDTAATLVLLQGEREVRREPLVLTAGEVNKLTY